MRRDGVHVSLNDHDAPLVPDGVLRDIERVKDRSLIKDRRLGRVHVLCGVFDRTDSLAGQQTSAETGHAAPLVANREHQPMAEPVVDTTLALDREA